MIGADIAVHSLTGLNKDSSKKVSVLFIVE